MRVEEGFFEQLLQLLPENWIAKARELGAFQRGREIKSPKELLHMILLYLTEGRSLAGTGALVRLTTGVKLSKEAVSKRIRNSGEWLQWLCENIYRRTGLTVAKPEWLQNKNVTLVDGSDVVKCGAQRQCHKLHYCLDLFTLAMREMHVTDNKTGEKLPNFKQFNENDIVICDRMYGTLSGIAHLQELGAGYVLRLRSGAFNMYDGKNQKIDLFLQLSELKEGEFSDIIVRCKINGQYEPIRICAMRKDQESEEAGLKRLVKENQRKRKGKPVSEQQQASNKYIIVATSLGVEVSAAQVLELYRLRWQIEIAFKRLKSLFNYNGLPSTHSESVKAWFYGKLLLAALCETMVNTGRFSPCGGTNRG